MAKAKSTVPRDAAAAPGEPCQRVSSVAKALKHKDGTGVFVIARHEIALQPGLAVWEGLQDPKDGKVKLDGENVTQFPQLPDFKQVTLKVLR